jgi:hypothetical protein
MRIAKHNQSSNDIPSRYSSDEASKNCTMDATQAKQAAVLAMKSQ